jgi:hypothetical protein
VIWFYLAAALAVLVVAIVLAFVLGFVRYIRELREDDSMDDYF